MKINGLMIDPARLLEPPAYYFRLMEFMSQWKMNALLFHFSDDHGCALRLPGFERLAMSRAFTPRQIKSLAAFGRARGVEVIPEVEMFGHTRYITDHPRYRRLAVGARTRVLKFNAIDPLHPGTRGLMRRLIAAVARVFPSQYIHLGCDEVDMSAYCRHRGLAVEEVWSDYVNLLIGLVRRAGKTPIIWGDHVSKSPVIAGRLRKDVVLVDWRYDEDIGDNVLARLKRAGFRELLAAPSLACYRHRFLPAAAALENTARMAAFAGRHKAMGLINTIWCPWRYLQNAMYYGIAYSARAVEEGGHPDMRRLNRRFANSVFGTSLTPALESFLESWPQLAIDFTLADKIVRRRPVFTRRDLRRLRAVNRLGKQALRAAFDYLPGRNGHIWHGMVLAAQCAWLCSEGMLIRLAALPGAGRRTRYNRLLSAVRREMDAEWDRTRYSDDPQKTKALFPDEAPAHAMFIIRRLPRAR